MKTAMVNQRGSALIVSLLLLIVLTLIGMTTMRTSRLETVMATNARESAIAFEAAEAALRDAEQFIEDVVSVAAFGGVGGGLLGIDDAEPNYHSTSTWSATNSKVYGSNPNNLVPDLPYVAQQPRYIIKYVGEVTNLAGQNLSINIGGYANQPGSQTFSMFRITSRGTGRNSESQVVIQTHYGKIF